MDRWKAEQGRGREKRKIRREKSRRERVRRKKMQMREKVGKSRNTMFFQWFGAPEGRKVGSLKRRVRSQLTTKHISKWKGTKHLSLGALLEVEMSKKSTRLWREAHFEVKMLKTPGVRTTFGSWDVEKVHAVVARSTFISKSKCTKHTMVGPLLEVEMSKKCTPLWREAHFQVKRYKTPQRRSTFGSWDVEKVHAFVARSTFPSQNVQNTRGSPLLEVQMSKKCTRLWREAHFEVKMLKTPGVRTTFGGPDVASLRFTTLHYTTLYSATNITTTTQLHSTTLHYTTLHSTTLHYTTLHYITLNDAAPQIDR